MSNEIPGFDYLTGKAVEHTAGEWRRIYSPADFTRSVSDGVTSYSTRHILKPAPKDWRPRTVAEAYAIIPAGKVTE